MKTLSKKKKLINYCYYIIGYHWLCCFLSEYDTENESILGIALNLQKPLGEE